VGLTVPRHLSEGILNRMITMQVLNSWKTRRILPVAQLEALIESLRAATFPPSPDSSRQHTFFRNDILRRVEDDRERHKRLKERIWVLPVPSLLEMSTSSSGSTASNPSKLATILTTVTVSPSSAELTGSAQTEPLKKLVSIAGYTKESTDAEDGTKSSAAPAGESAREIALDIEFEQAWENVPDSYRNSQLDEVDLRAMDQENLKCFGEVV